MSADKITALRALTEALVRLITLDAHYHARGYSSGVSFELSRLQTCIARLTDAIAEEQVPDRTPILRALNKLFWKVNPEGVDPETAARAWLAELADADITGIEFKDDIFLFGEPAEM